MLMSGLTSHFEVLMTDLQYSIDRIKKIALLEDGWHDGYGEKIPSKVIEQAFVLVAMYHMDSLPFPRIYPTLEKSMSFEWGAGCADVAIEIMEDGSLELFALSDTEDGLFCYEPTHSIQLTVGRLENLLIAKGIASQTLAVKHLRHSRLCNCLNDASECCDTNCECHQTEGEQQNG